MADAHHFIFQGKPALLESAHHQFVHGRHTCCPVDQGVEIGVGHRQFDQASIGRMQIGFHEMGLELFVWQWRAPCATCFDNTSMQLTF